MLMLRHNDYEQLRHYLLGDVAANEQKTIEERLLTNTRYFDELVRIEEELTDQYAAGELDPRERKLFEARFMHNPDRREGVEFARTLRRYTEQQAPPLAGSPRTGALLFSRLAGWRAATAMAGASVVIILAAGLVLLGRQAAHLKHQYESLQQEQKQSMQREAALSQQLDQERARAKEFRSQLQHEHDEQELLRQKLAAARTDHQPGTFATMASLTLLPGRSRTAGPAATVRLSATTQELRLILEIDAGRYREYVVEVQTAEGNPVWKQAIKTVHRAKGTPTIAATLPVPMLTMRDYLVLLAGVNADGTSEHLATYNFTVLRE